jgi:anaphase-promoting complex subunit 3
MEAILCDRVNYYLGFYLYDNATFLCERLYAEYTTESNLHLLATCFYQSGHPNRAFTVLQGSTSAENRYLFALCCYKLEKLQEAETALLQGTNIRGRGPSKCRDEILAQVGPNQFIFLLPRVVLIRLRDSHALYRTAQLV